MEEEKREVLINYQNELSQLLAWFKWYDMQVMQYNRELRQETTLSVDIQALDNQAIENARRIKELRESIERIISGHDYDE